MKYWFTPNIASMDMLELFDAEGEALAHAPVDVFKFYAQHILGGPVGPNTYDALRDVGAFHAVRIHGLQTAVEMGAVKESSCDGEHHYRQFDILRDRIDRAGGKLDYIAFDEPLVSGKVCGQRPTETARYTAKFAKHIQASGVRVGLIEAWPYSSLGTFQTFLGELLQNGFTPAFLHLDLDWKDALRRGEPFLGEHAKKARLLATQFGLELGLILAGYDGDETSYITDVRRLAANVLPLTPWDHVIVQSWAIDTRTGTKTIPTNIPTHLNLLGDVVLRRNLPPAERWKPSFWKRLRAKLRSLVT